MSATWRGYHEGGLGAPVVGEVEALVVEFEPAVDPVEVESEKVVAKAVDFGPVGGEVDE